MEPRVYHKNVKTGGSDTWGTPRELFETLDREFSFTLDPCANPENAKADRFFTADQNGLLQSWAGERVFMNPPYSEIKAWARKALEESLRGALVVCLVPARTGSKWFREYMAPGEVRFLTQRIKFILPNGEPAPNSAGFDSAVVILEPGGGEPITLYWDWESDPFPNGIESPSKGDDRERPALRYYGSKFLMAPWIIEHFPEGYRELHYIEPYGGSGAVLLRKAPSVMETFNDLDSAVITFFRVLRERPKELIESLRLTPYAREEYQLSILSELPAWDDLEKARRFFVQYWQSIGGAHDRPGWKVSRNKSGRYTTNPDSFIKSIRNLYRVSERLRGVQIENMGALALIDKCDHEDSLFYVDPPYPMETRGSQSASYAHELTGEDHEALAAVLRGVKGYVLLSSYESDLYSELYGSHDWVSVFRESRINGGGNAREVLWVNPRLARELGLGEGGSESLEDSALEVLES